MSGLEPVPESCAECGGSGWVQTEESSRVRRCSCRARRGTDHLVRLAAIPPRYRNCSLDNFRVSYHEQLVRALSVCRQYVADFLSEDGCGFRDTGLLFTGPPGAGKTHLAVAVLVDLVETYRVRGLFADFTALTQELHATMDPQSSNTRSSLLAPLESAEVLVIDELAAQKPSLWASDIVYNVINQRYASRQPTIFTTNYRLDESPARESLDRGPDAAHSSLLANRVPAMLESRLYEMAQPVTLDAVSDYRRDVRAHQHPG